MVACSPLRAQSASQTGSLPSAPLEPGYVKGTVTDAAGALVPFARVELTSEAEKTPLTLHTDANGEYFFPVVHPGRFTLKVLASGFERGNAADTLLPGQHDEMQPVVLRIATASTEVEVTPFTRVELAEQEVKIAEQQRAFGILPDFFVVYDPHPVPLDAKQKFKLAIHGAVDPFPFISSAVVAGVQQGLNSLPGYHQGLEGYAKRYGAQYVNFASATLLRDAFFPSVFRQDPRYHFRGPGEGPEHTTKARILYALSTAVICYSDNGKKQFDYSAVLGNLSAGALTNLYYPPGSRNGIGTTLENGLLATVGVGAGHLLQEYISGFVPSHRDAEAKRKAAAKAQSGAAQ